MFAGIGLEVIAFPKQVDVSQISDETIFNLGLIAGPVPMIIYFFAAYLASKYDLNKKKHEEICAQLEAQEQN